MENYIIVGILIAIGMIGIGYTVKHFKRKSGCCGSSDYRHKPKKLSTIIGQKTFKVEGMHCDHCKSRVEEAVDDIKGVSGKVNLKTGNLTVLYAEDVSDETIIARVEKVGYRIV